MHPIDAHFEGRPPAVRAVYDRILETARQFGPFQEEPKKTSIHLARKSAFAGVATRRDSLILTLKSSGDIDSVRIVKRERTSANRWHLEIKLTKPAEIDAELKRWMRDAYELAG